MLFLYYAPISETLNQGQGEGLATFVCWSQIDSLLGIKNQESAGSTHVHYHFVSHS